MVASIMAPLVQRGRAGLLRPADATGHITDARRCRPMEVRDATAEGFQHPVLGYVGLHVMHRRL